jgi:hypothetical protein
MPRHRGRAALVDGGRSAVTLRAAGETARSVSPEKRLPGRAVGAPDAEPLLSIAEPAQESILRDRSDPDPRALCAHPAIRDAGVIGIPRTSSGELVCAASVASVDSAVVIGWGQSRPQPDAAAATESSDPAPSSTPSRRPGDGR